MSERVISVWSNPKWRILFDVTKLDRVKAWDVKLAEIIRAFMEELRKLESIDLSPCGVALYSASTIHRIKSDKLLKADFLSQPKEKPQLFIPQPIDLPIPPEFMIMTIEDLASSLMTVLYRRVEVKNTPETLIQEYTSLNIEDYLVKLEERIEEFIKTLKDIFKEYEMIDFKILTMGVDRVEAVRRFILLLLAASRGLVDILQDEESGKIMVKWVGGEGL
ncbi:MAG: segregation/condensation protein A [Aigarchaeota archaeon]|nr:segregation/condensation protein A [Aigarchaeota archaeon]MCX8193388.1 segregation/condensation protein A [Nitrososphaeria archaeon]MDW7985918.1 segregation/condensation protein A [Nitrososphaerota archaeon]